MEKHVRTTAICAGILAVSIGTLPVAASESNVPAPNVLWIVLDACRADHLGCYGYQRPTSPNIDALAADGVVFEQNFTQAPCTVRSVPSYFTGRYFPVPAFPLAGWKAFGKVPPDNEIYVSALFNKAGYRTIMISGSPWTTRHSRLWDTFDDARLVEPEKDKAYPELETLNDHVRDALDNTDDQLFFLYLHAMDTHRPHYRNQLHPTWFPGGDTRKPPEPPFDNTDRQWLRAEYDCSVTYSDKHLADLFDCLEKRGLRDNTVILLTADHGELLGEDGHSLNHPSYGHVDELYHVPLIMAGPGLPKGKRIDLFTESVDISPTLCQLAGIQHTAETDGTSLVPYLRDNPADAGIRQYVFAKLGRENPVYVLRSADHKLLYNPVTGRDKLLAVPDRLGKTRVINAPMALSMMKKTVHERYMPLYKRYKELPFKTPSVFAITLIEKHFRNLPDRVVINRGFHATDDKWDYEDDALWSHAWSEDAPPIKIRLEVPNGKFLVELEVFGESKQGRSGSVLSVKAETDTAFTVIPKPQEARAMLSRPGVWKHVPLGIYSIEDSTFELTVDEGHPDYWAALKSIRFRLADKLDEIKIDTDCTLTRQKEQLRALGYLE